MIFIFFLWETRKIIHFKFKKFQKFQNVKQYKSLYNLLNFGAGEMTQQLWPQAAPLKDPGSIPSAHNCNLFQGTMPTGIHTVHWYMHEYKVPIHIK